MPDEGNPIDRDMMNLALRLAHRGLGNTASNPAVGAVICDERSGEIIARGWTQPGGRPHAESEALRRAADRARGATMYVTLEPCAHFGKTPPCADAIIAAGLKRVVIGIEDPDARTAGAGIARLRAAGIDVEVGVQRSEANWVTRGHVLRMTQGRPFVTIKIATDATGEIAAGDGTQPVWVTGPHARAAGHLLRARADAIGIGSGTLRTDNPELTCRLPGLADRTPVRVVLASRDPVPLGARLVQTAGRWPTWVIRPVGGADTAELSARGVLVFELPGEPQGVAIHSALAMLAERGMTRVLVEGGPTMWRVFAEANLIDEVVVFQAGDVGPLDRARGVVTRYLGDHADVILQEHRPVGGDTVWRWRALAAVAVAGA
jgi:diaminohydroxyphosphoribosylaminopyrimidine deaminase/5-amino-6-(5-phosphoribosylamino)uracil reductase